MKIENIQPRQNLATEAKRRQAAFEHSSVPTPQIYNLEAQGWVVDGKTGKFKTRIKRAKSLASYIEDRTWTVLHKMGFPFLCSEGGAKIWQNESVWNQLDCLAYDEEAAVIVECKSAEEIKSKDNLPKEIFQLDAHRRNVAQALREENPQRKLRVGAILVLYDIEPSEADIERANNSNIVLLDAAALEYYEKLVEHTGEAAKYQLLSEVFSNMEINNLKIIIPAVEAKFGKSVAYTFAITPEHLLKLSYVAHRNRGELGSAGSGAYQRMVKKTRLAAIRKFIEGGGVFPTNIVVNFTPPKSGGNSGLRFEQTTQLDGATQNIKLGWLHLPARYQSAWIIDGQHRLLAYSGLEKAKKAFLSVTAFDGLDVSEQSELFTKINSEQKKVSGSLLTELYADLKWNSDNEEEQVQSIVSRAVLYLNSRTSSPFYRRILMADEISTDIKCISLKSITDALRKPGFFLVRRLHGKWIEFGPLWAAKPEPTLKRTRTLLDGWFCAVSKSASNVWSKGKAEGGYIAMNNGIVVCLEVLRSVFDHLQSQGINVISLKDDQLLTHIQPFGELVGEYFGTLTNSELHQLRRKVGTTGQVEARYLVQKAIHDQIPDYNPEGLAQWLSNRADDKRGEAKQRLDSIENRVRARVVKILQEDFGFDHALWWSKIPQTVRVTVAKQREQDNRAKGDEEAYLTFKDLRKIILSYWQDLFQSDFAYGIQGDKNKRTEWLAELSTIQALAVNNEANTLQMEQYSAIVRMDGWLAEKGI